MQELRCIFCRHHLFNYDCKGEFHIMIKCDACNKTNVLSFARVFITTSNFAVTIGQ